MLRLPCPSTAEALPPRLVLKAPAEASREPPVRPSGPGRADAFGVVVDAAGRPVEGVWVEHADGSFDTTGAGGSFHIEGPFTGRTVDLVVEGYGYLPIHAAGLVGAPSRIRLPERSSVRIEFQAPPGLTETSHETEFLVWTGPSMDERAFGSRTDGALLIDGLSAARLDLPEGRHYFAIRRRPGGWVAYPGVEVLAGSPARVVYTYPPPAALRGTVLTPRRGAVPGAWIFLARTHKPLCHTDALGRFDLSAAPEGPRAPVGLQLLRVEAKGFAPLLTGPLDLGSPGDIELTMPHGVLVRGRVEGAELGPQGGGVVWLSPWGHSMHEAGIGLDGVFEFSVPFCAGLHKLAVEIDGRRRHVFQVSVREGASPLVLRMP